MKDRDREAIISALAGEASFEELRRAAEWRAATEENEKAFLQLSRLWAASGEIAPPAGATTPPSPHLIVETARQREGSGATLASSREYRPSVAGLAGRLTWPIRWGAAWAAAGVATLAFGLGFWISQSGEGRPFGAGSFVTGVDEVATVTLQDETVVRLGPSSRLTILELDGTREVSLVGRAYFAVARDDERPFRVRLTSGDVVEVLGTRFDVSSRDGSFQVAVAEGAVRIGTLGTRLEIGANQVATILEGEVPRVERVEDVYQVIDWLGSFLAFESTPMRDVAEELRRRFGVQIEVVDPELGERTLTGWFADQPPEAIIGGICRVVAAHCTVEDGVHRMALAP